MNQVNISGRLTKDIDLRYTSGSQMAVARFTVAVNRAKNNGEADFIRVVVFGNQAENAERYIGKGCRVIVEGRLQTGSYENNKGETIYTTDVVANRVEFIDFRDDDETADEEQNIWDDYGFAQLNEEIPF